MVAGARRNSGDRLVAVVLGLVAAATISTSCLAQVSPKPCSLRCETIRGRDAPQRIDFDVEGIDRTNHYLRNLSYTRTGLGLMMRGKGLAISAAASTVPGAGGVGKMVEAGYDLAAKGLEIAITSQITDYLEADIHDRLRRGETHAQIAQGLDANMRATINALIGEDSLYSDIAKDATAYDKIQNGAITAIANKLDQVIEAGNADRKNLAQVKQEVISKAKELNEVREKLVADKARAMKEIEEDVAAEARKAAQEAPGSAAAKSEAAQRTVRDYATRVAKTAELAAGQFDAAALTMKNLGASEDAVRVVSGLAALSHVGAGIAASYVNPMAILPTLASASSLFGGGDGPDPNTVAILASLQSLHLKVDQLRREVEGYHRAEMAEIGKVQTGLVGLLGVLKEQEDKALRQCNNTIPTRLTVSGASIKVAPQWAWDEAPGGVAFDGVIVNAAQLRPMSYDDVARIWNDNNRQILACQDALRSTLAQFALPAGFSITDLLNEVKAGATEATNAERPESPFHNRYQASLQVSRWIGQVRPIIELSRVLDADQRQYPELAWALTDPALNLVELEAKASDLTRAARHGVSRPGLSPATRREFVDWVVAKPADADLISRVSAYALTAGWWPEFIRPDGSLRGRDEMDDSSTEPVVTVLGRAGDALRIAISQQAAISGDIILIIAHDRLARADAALPTWLGETTALRATEQDKARVALATTWWTERAGIDLAAYLNGNPLAMRNFGLLFAARALSDTKHIMTQYDIAWASPDPSAMRTVLGDPAANLVRKDTHWFLSRTYRPPKAAGANSEPTPVEYVIPLPLPDDLRGGDLSHSRAFQTAALIWSQVEQELLIYTFAPRTAEDAEKAVETARSGALLF